MFGNNLWEYGSHKQYHLSSKQFAIEEWVINNNTASIIDYSMDSIEMMLLVSVGPTSREVDTIHHQDDLCVSVLGNNRWKKRVTGVIVFGTGANQKWGCTFVYKHKTLSIFSMFHLKLPKK